MLIKWILPMLVAGAHRPTDPAVRWLTLLYNTLLGFAKWGVITTQLSQHKAQGGYASTLALCASKIESPMVSQNTPLGRLPYNALFVNVEAKWECS